MVEMKKFTKCCYLPQMFSSQCLLDYSPIIVLTIIDCYASMISDYLNSHQNQAGFDFIRMHKSCNVEGHVTNCADCFVIVFPVVFPIVLATVCLGVLFIVSVVHPHHVPRRGFVYKKPGRIKHGQSTFGIFYEDCYARDLPRFVCNICSTKFYHLFSIVT